MIRFVRTGPFPRKEDAMRVCNQESLGDTQLVCEAADDLEVALEEHFAIDETFLSTCTKPGLSRSSRPSRAPSPTASSRKRRP